MAERVTFEFDLGYLNGTTQFIVAEEGRDRIALDDARLKIELHPDDDTIEEYLITRSALAYLHTTKRRHPEPVTTSADGRLQIVGRTPS